MILSSLIKKLAATLTAVALLSTAAISVFAAPVTGDLNNDGVVDVTDATKLQKVLAQLEKAGENYETVAQTYVDGKINIKDATAIQMFSAKMINSLPYNPKGGNETTPTESTQPTEESTTQPTESTQPTQSTTQRGTDEDGWNDGIYRPF